jgi:DNA-binding CsgD family transcriptional regulator
LDLFETGSVQGRSTQKVPVHSEVSTPGVLLLTESIGGIGYNWEAIRILAFPTNPERIEHIQRFLAKRVRATLASQRSTDTLQFVGEFRSGQRTYICHVLDLCSTDLRAEEKGAATVLVLQRQSSTTLSLKRRARNEFRLSQRECETVELLLEGMTTKEIAAAMNISPNTVKSFVRLIMTKLNVSTRPGIIGKILVRRSH